MTIDAYCTIGIDREYDLTGEALVKQMDSAGVERAVIAPVDRAMAVYNRDGNQLMCRTWTAYRDRLIPSCSVNPWYNSAALKEFARATSEGARMLVLHPFLQGFLANDELVFPVLEAAAREAIPVYIHTGVPAVSTPWQVADLAERFPSLDFIMGHCGATDFWNDVVLAAARFPNLFIESSLARPFGLVAHARKLDPGRAVMGSWTPVNDLRFEWEQMRKCVPPGLWEAMSGQNLRRLLEKRAAL